MRYNLRRVIVFLVLICFVLMIAHPAVSLAWDEEILRGTYAYESKSLSILFVWGDDGVEQLRINGRAYPNAKYDIAGNFGNAVLVRIRVEETPTALKVIDLLFFHDQTKPLIISGYYADMRDIREDGSFTAYAAKPVEMHFRSVPKRPDR